MFGWLRKIRSETAGGLTSPVSQTAIQVQAEKAEALFLAARYSAAAVAFQKVLAKDSANLLARTRLMRVHLEQGDVPAAKREADIALTLYPSEIGIMLQSAYIAKCAGDHTACLALLRRTQAEHPNFEALDLQIADECATLGQGSEAIAALDRAIALDPRELNRRSLRLFLLNFFGGMSRRALFVEHRKWGSMVDKGFAASRKKLRVDRQRERALRIGIVSGDLRLHSVALFIEGYLREHDRERYPIFCFDVSPHREDAVTERLRKHVDGWHSVATLDDDALADEIREQQIDVLIDLSGHTKHHRLLMFARRPAPVQVTWFGYMNTTGLTSINYRLTDERHAPLGESQAFYTEKLFYLPSLACFTPDARSPAVAPSPFTKNGHVTFISANQWAKVTEPVRQLWAEILCDDSRPHLKIIAAGASSQEFRESVVNWFVAQGVHADQVELLPTMDLPTFLAYFGHADVALDPFPYGGGTTTLHTVWMGVPIIAMQGDTELGRATPGMLVGFGLPDFVANTREEYRDIAIALARNPSRLVDIRANLRQRMADSSALDAQGLAQNVENVFRTMWHTYCASR